MIFFFWEPAARHYIKLMRGKKFYIQKRANHVQNTTQGAVGKY
jgi:hypothetical protein